VVLLRRVHHAGPRIRPHLRLRRQAEDGARTHSLLGLLRWQAAALPRWQSSGLTSRQLRPTGATSLLPPIGFGLQITGRLQIVAFCGFILLVALLTTLELALRSFCGLSGLVALLKRSSFQDPRRRVSSQSGPCGP